MDEVFGNLCFKNEIIVRRGTKNVQSQFETIDALSTGHDMIYLMAMDRQEIKTLFRLCGTEAGQCARLEKARRQKAVTFGSGVPHAKHTLG